MVFSILKYKNINIKVNPVTLSFKKDIEKDFLEHYLSKYLNHIRLAMIFGIIIWGLFGIIDRWISPPETIYTLFLIRYAIVWPIMVFCLFASYSKNFINFFNSIIFLGILSCGLGVVAKISLLPQDSSLIWNASLIVTFIYGYAMMRARFIWASSASFIIIAAHIISSTYYMHLPLSIIFNNCFFLISANLVGMYICYSMESFARKDFLYSELIEIERKNTEEINKKLKVEIGERIQAEKELEGHQDNLKLLILERTKELDDTQHEIVSMLGTASEYRDNETAIHIKRMSKYCKLLAETIGLSKEQCELLGHASQMHDIGKIGIPDSILQKPGKLTKDEWEIMKTHSTIGTQILSGNNSRLLQMAKTIALTHHEKWDGTGYPKGLKGENIPLIGRIVCLCDVFDALTSDRPYKKAWSLEDTLAEIEKSESTFFDPILVKKFRAILPDILSINSPD